MSFATNPAAFGIQSQAAASASAFAQRESGGGTGSVFGGSQPSQPAAFGSTTSQNPLLSGFGQNQQQQQPAASTSAFGQPAQQQPTGSIFGQSSQQQQNAPTNSLFGQPAQQQQQPTGSIFGQSSQQQTAPTNSLFGQSAQQQQQQPTNSLFGQSQQKPQIAPTNSLFGQPQQQQAAPANSLFGQSAPTGSLFGQSQQQQSAPTNSLFGQSQQQQSAPTNSLFGQSQQQQPQSSAFGGSSIFNTSSTQPSSFASGGFGGGSILGGPQKAPQQQQQLQPSGAPPFTKSTKFNDLPDEIKRTLEQIDTHIQGRIQISKDLHQRKLGQEATKGQGLVRVVHKDLVNTTSTIRNDSHLTRDLKAKADQAVQDTIIATRIIDGVRNPQANGSYLKDHANFPLEYFTRVTEQMREYFVWYKSTIEQIERKLSSLTNQTQYTPQGISSTLQAQNTIFLALANKTAALDAELQRIKTLYTQLWRARTGSVRDPFNALDMDKSSGDMGFGGLKVQ